MLLLLFPPDPLKHRHIKVRFSFFFLVLFQWLKQLNPGAQSLWVTHLKGRRWFDVLHTASLHIFPSCCLSSCNPLISVTCFTSNKLKMMLFSFLSAVHKVLLCLYKKDNILVTIYVHRIRLELLNIYEKFIWKQYPELSSV